MVIKIAAIGFCSGFGRSSGTFLVVIGSAELVGLIVGDKLSVDIKGVGALCRKDNPEITSEVGLTDKCQ